jgi:copper chaperone CopZ
MIVIWGGSQIANAQILKAELVANGLTCSMCSNATLKQLKTIAFLDSIDIDIESTKFILYFKRNTPVDLNRIKAKVEDAGFSVGSLILFMEFNNTSVFDAYRFTKDETSYHFIDTKNKQLNNIEKIKVLDKGFMSDKEYKKYEKIYSKYPCYTPAKIDSPKQHYHLKVIE